MPRQYNAPPTRTIPVDVTLTGSDLLYAITRDLFEQEPTKYEVLSYRFQLDGKTYRTLDELGSLKRVTRERIRQIEHTALNQLRELIKTGVSKRTALEKSVKDQVEVFHQSLLRFAPIAKESDILTFSCEFWETEAFDLSILRLLLELFNFTYLGTANEPKAWIFEELDRERLERASFLIHKYLREWVEAATWEDIALAIAKRDKGIRFKPNEIQNALLCISEVEKVDDKRYQVVYQDLPAIEDRVYRLFYEKSPPDPFDINEVTQLYNAKAKQLRLSTSSVGVVSGALSRDPRFQNIGKSGKWVLTKWKYNPDALLGIPALIQRVLQQAGQPLSFDDLYTRMNQIRAVTRDEVRTNLSNNRAKFPPLVDGRFGLRTWRQMNNIALPTSRREVSLRKARVAEAIERVFTERSTHELSLTVLNKAICAQFPESSPLSVASAVLKSPAVSISGTSRRKVATFNPQYRQLMSGVDVAAKGESRKGFIQSVIRDVLLENTGRIQLRQLRTLVAVRAHINEHKVYGYVKGMPDVEKEKTDDGIAFIVLRNPTSEQFDTLIRKLRDADLQKEVKRAISNLTVPNVDLALFSLGKSFDAVSKAYFVALARNNQVKTKSGNLIGEVDTQQYNLKGRIDQLVSNGYLSESGILNLLREERNDPAHNIAPQQKRQEMMRTAPVLARMYIEYILLFEEELLKLP